MQRKSDWYSGSEHAGHEESILVLTFCSKTSFCNLKLHLNIHLSLMYKAPDIPCCALQRIPRIHFHNLSVSLISAPQQVSEIYTTVCPFNFTHFIVNLREKEDYSWFICDFNSHFFFLFFFFCPRIVSVDQFGFQMIQILSHYFLVVTGQLLPYFT